jgi:hypothetical protein
VGVLKTETEKYAPKLGPLLQEGETVAVANRVNHMTDVKKVGVLGAMARLGGLFADGEVNHMPAGSMAARVPLEKMSLFVLTDKRALFVKMVGGLKPGAVIAEYPVGDVKAVESAPAKVHYGKLAIVFADDSRVVLDLMNDRGVDVMNERCARLLGPL